VGIGMTGQPDPPDGYGQPEQCNHPQRLEHKVRTRIGHQILGRLAPDGKKAHGSCGPGLVHREEVGLVAAGASLGQWLRALRATLATTGRWRRLPGVLLAWRDAAPFVRLHFLAVATDIGLLEELHHGPATTNQLGARLAIGDQALFGAFLRLGTRLGELRCRAGRWSLRGRRSNALAAPEAHTMRAMVQEAVAYDAAVYAELASTCGARHQATTYARPGR
jgi:hypothetical protein